MDNALIKEIITENKLLEKRRLLELEALSASSEQDLYTLIVNGGYLKEESLLPLIAQKLGISFQSIEADFLYPEDLIKQIPQAVRETKEFLPLSSDGNVMRVAVANPMLVEAIDLIEEKTGLEVEPVLASPAVIREILDKGSGSDSKKTESAIEMDTKSLEDLANEAPIIKLVNLTIMRAISEGASDIHIEPYEDEAIVRYRIDGVLREISRHSAKECPAIISRIKIMANLNIAERRIPQDGRISLRLLDRNFDLRVATIPVLHQEGVVMRILDKDSKILDLTEMAFTQDILQKFSNCIKQPHGIILLTGPTGSGKTTTLNAAISDINSPDKKIITIEDPVEYEIKGVTQIQVNAKIGLTFATGLRSILRLDPDVVMVGEIRDTETAEIAIRTALTGHLVFSTLHTNTAPSSITRLFDLNIEPYLISSCLNAVLSQRLVRRVCQFCAKQQAPSKAAQILLAEIGQGHIKQVVTPVGCDECNKSGYHGRLAIHEFFEVTEELRDLINQKESADKIFEKARFSGMKTLREDGIEKFLAGMTSAEEIIRVTQMD